MQYYAKPRSLKWAIRKKLHYSNENKISELI